MADYTISSVLRTLPIRTSRGRHRLPQVYNAEETLAVSGELMNRNNYRVVLEEILAYGEVSRDCLPRNIDQLAGREQASGAADN